ncbi:uncharacterized protein MONOS_3213 [Monocercomonoides exilis]|uniref:uncharacterized protein n=1 Tax=Monocercomonoides exilis TaxID=2049356 RepID=UPI003559CC00|nr:hypothetical protein MONOS_3213 [Monocercomonoides exilis]|eukprot:MONOS_3213.1-p1 / transcript=MONOS_3213.1 / gene=MONOS_3213 / organism=Monocercomonoides_exilis_PA203 / gene_product=unspecified product / transcript_product=unspecified product / location=Mono_scaffold00073:120348-125326(-) / protein_length=1486 / sequence_SO=supercontig / SO=protein_coding / is_pseudo=false
MSLPWLPKDICKLEDISREELYPHWGHLKTLHKINASIEILVDLIRLFCPNSLPLKQKAIAFVFNALVDFDNPICAIEGIRGIGVLIESTPRFIPGVIQIGFFERLARRIEKEMKRKPYFEEEIRMQQRRRGRSPPPDQSSSASRSFKCSSKSRSPPPKLSLTASSTSPPASPPSTPPVSPSASASASASVMDSSGNPQEKSSKQQKAQKMDFSSITQKKPEETGQKGKSKENTANAIKDEKKKHSVSPPPAQKKQKQNKENGKNKGKNGKTSKSRSPPPAVSNKREISLSPPPSAKTSSSSSVRKAASKSPPPKCASSAFASASVSSSSNKKDSPKTSSQSSSKQKTESKAFSLFEFSSSSSSSSSSNKKIERKKRKEEEEEEEDSDDEDSDEDDEEDEDEDEEEEEEEDDDDGLFEGNVEISKQSRADKFVSDEAAALKTKKKRTRNKKGFNILDEESAKEFERVKQDAIDEEVRKEEEWIKNYAQFDLFCETCLNTIERFLPEDDVGLVEVDEKSEKEVKENEEKEETELKEEETKEKKDQTEEKDREKEKERELKEKLEKEKEFFKEKQKYKKEIDVNAFKCLQSFLGFALTMRNVVIRKKAQKIIDWITLSGQNSEMDKKAGKENEIKEKEKEGEVKKTLPKSLKESWSLSEEVTNAALLLSEPQTAQSGLNLLLWLFRHAHTMSVHQAICSFLFHSPFLSIIHRLFKKHFSVSSNALPSSSTFAQDLLRVLWWFVRGRKEAALKVARMGMVSELVRAIPQVAEELLVPCLAVVSECVRWREAFWIALLTSPFIEMLINLCSSQTHFSASSSLTASSENVKIKPYLLPSVYLMMRYVSERFKYSEKDDNYYYWTSNYMRRYRMQQRFNSTLRSLGSCLYKLAEAAVDDSVADAAGVLSLLLCEKFPFEQTRQEKEEEAEAVKKEKQMEDSHHHFIQPLWTLGAPCDPPNVVEGTASSELIYPSETHPIVQSCISLVNDDEADMWKMVFEQKLEELRSQNAASNAEAASSSSSASKTDECEGCDAKESNSCIFEELKSEMRQMEDIRRKTCVNIPPSSANQIHLQRDRLSSAQTNSSSNGDQKIKQGSTLPNDVSASSENAEKDEDEVDMNYVINSVELSIPVDPLVKVESGLTAMSAFAGQNGIDFRMRPLYSRSTFSRALALSSFPHPRIILSALYAMDSFATCAFGVRAAGAQNIQSAARRAAEIIQEVYTYQQRMKGSTKVFESGTYFLNGSDVMPSSVPSCSVFPSCFSFIGCENELLYAAFQLLLHILNSKAGGYCNVLDKRIMYALLDMISTRSCFASCIYSNEIHSPMLYVPLFSSDVLSVHPLPQPVSDCIWTHGTRNLHQTTILYKSECGRGSQTSFMNYVRLFLRVIMRSPQLIRELAAANYAEGICNSVCYWSDYSYYSEYFIHLYIYEARDFIRAHKSDKKAMATRMIESGLSSIDNDFRTLKQRYGNSSPVHNYKVKDKEHLLTWLI